MPAGAACTACPKVRSDDDADRATPRFTKRPKLSTARATRFWRCPIDPQGRADGLRLCSQIAEHHGVSIRIPQVRHGFFEEMERSVASGTVVRSIWRFLFAVRAAIRAQAWRPQMRRR